MASITSAGIGSGLDVNSLVTSLVSAERTPVETQLAKLESSANTKISALGTFKSVLSAFKDAAAALVSGGIAKVSATSSDATVFSASAVSGTTSGNFDIEVVSLAKAEKKISADYASATATVGNGTVTIGSGTDSFSVTLADGSNDLKALRDAINNSTDNDSVNASIVTDSNGSHLVLIGRNTGAANAITVSSASAVDGTSFINMSTPQPAVDAHIRVDGVDAYSASNTVGNAIDGVTLNLLKANSGTTYSLTLGSDSKSAGDAVQKFVTNYNALVAISNSLTKYDATAKTGGALIGDPAVRGIRAQLRNILGSEVSGVGSAFSNLTQLGITTKTDGTLTLDSAKLTAALGKDTASVQKIFSADGGYAKRISDVLGQYLDKGGQIDAETEGLQKRLKDVSKQRDQLDLRMTAFEKRYRSQFTALDTLVSQLKSTQDFLTQQLTVLSNINKSDS